MKENRHQAPLAPQQRYPRSSGPIQHPLHTSRHHIPHEVHLSYAANWRIKHLAETWVYPTARRWTGWRCGLCRAHELKPPALPGDIYRTYCHSGQYQSSAKCSQTCWYLRFPLARLVSHLGQLARSGRNLPGQAAGIGRMGVR